jgi:hypothetical protein
MQTMMVGCAAVPVFAVAVLMFALPEHGWMRHDVILKDRDLTVSVEHRSHGTFRTRVWNEEGAVTVEDGEGFADSRLVNLYASPSGAVIIASYAKEPVVITLKGGRAPSSLLDRVGLKGKTPSDLSRAEFRREMALASKWRYLGVVRREGSNSLIFTHEPECQQWDLAPPTGPNRKVIECNDSNYGGGNDVPYTVTRVRGLSEPAPNISETEAERY